jgi:hypothetical protein
VNPAKNYFVKALTELIVGNSAILPRVGVAEKRMKFFRCGHIRSTDSFPQAVFLIMTSSGVGRPLRAKSSRILSRFYLRLCVSTRLTSGRVKRFSLKERSGPATRHYCLSLYVPPSDTLWLLLELPAPDQGFCSWQRRQAGAKARGGRRIQA